MFPTFATVVRSNQNGIMYRYTAGAYAIFDPRIQAFTPTGGLNAVKKAWNSNYANSRQFVAMGNHRYLTTS